MWTISVFVFIISVKISTRNAVNLTSSITKMPETHVHNINTDIMPAKRLKTGLEKTNGFANGGLHQNGNQNGNHNANQNGISGKRKNQFGELSDGQMTLNDWVTQWDKGRTKFHRPSVHP